VTVVLLPSLGRPASDFDRLADDLRAAGHRVVALDLPGVGAAAAAGSAAGSATRAGDDLHAIAADVAARVVASVARLDPPDGPGRSGSPQPSSRRVDVVGHAFGNRVARCLAADHPELVRSLVLLGCGGKVPGDPAARDALGQCFSLPEGTTRHRAAVAEAFFGPGNEVPSSWEVGWWPEAAAAQSRASAATPVDDWWLPPEPVSVLAVVGAADRISPPGNAIELARALGPRCRVEIIPGAGHALLPERPAALAAAVGAFLAGLGT
jgi:pimeloyl-ACP methyl ester carboxylesterase